MALWCFGYQRALQTFPKQAALYGESPAVRFSSPRSPQQTPPKPRPGRDQAKAKLRLRRDHAETNTNTTPARAERRESNRSKSRKATERKHGRRRQAAPIAAQMPHARSRAPCRSSRARNPDLSFGSPRQRRPICRQASPLGGDDRTIDPAPQRRFGMARHRWALGMAGHLRPGLPADSTPTPAVSAQTDLECRSFGPSPARRPAQAMRHQSQRRPAPVGASKSCFDCFAGASIPQPGIRPIRAGSGPKRPEARRNARFTEWIPRHPSPSAERRRSPANVSRDRHKET